MHPDLAPRLVGFRMLEFEPQPASPDLFQPHPVMICKPLPVKLLKFDHQSLRGKTECFADQTVSKLHTAKTLEIHYFIISGNRAVSYHRLGLTEWRMPANEIKYIQWANLTHCQEDVDLSQEPLSLNPEVTEPAIIADFKSFSGNPWLDAIRTQSHSLATQLSKPSGISKSTHFKTIYTYDNLRKILPSAGEKTYNR